MPDPVRRLLDLVAAGQLPDSDGRVEVHPQPAGPSAGVLGFTAHHVIAAEVSSAWVRERLDPDNLSAPLGAVFLTALAERLGRSSGALDVVLVASSLTGPPPLELLPLAADHPRVDRARRYRRDIRAYCCAGGAVLVGRGFAGRWETAFEVDPGSRGHGLGRALAGAARHLVPAGEPVWAQVSPGNAASLRATIAAGYIPVGSEVLFPDDSLS